MIKLQGNLKGFNRRNILIGCNNNVQNQYCKKISYGQNKFKNVFPECKRNEKKNENRGTEKQAKIYMDARSSLRDQNKSSNRKETTRKDRQGGDKTSLS